MLFKARKDSMTKWLCYYACSNLMQEIRFQEFSVNSMQKCSHVWGMFKNLENAHNCSKWTQVWWMLTTAASAHMSGEFLQHQKHPQMLWVFPRLCSEHFSIVLWTPSSVGSVGNFSHCCKHFTVLWAFPTSVSFCQHFSVLWIIFNVVCIFQCCDEHFQMLWVVNVINIVNS